MSVTGQIYTSPRPRGFNAWNPRSKTLVLLEQIDAVLAEYEDFLPLTGRQIFYRLVGAYDYPKTDNDYSNLLDKLVRARRSGRIPFSSIRDDGGTVDAPQSFANKAEFWGAVESTAEHYRRDRREGQLHDLEVWCEAAGMVPQLAQVAHPYGVAVYSSGGFDSVTVKHDAAQRYVNRDRGTVVLHIGDLDASGCSIVDSAAEDIGAFVEGLNGCHEIRFQRVAVTRDQADELDLPTAPPKKGDRRGGWDETTVQAEALAPDQLRELLIAALDEWTDLDVLAAVREEEERDRAELLDEIPFREEER